MRTLKLAVPVLLGVLVLFLAVSYFAAKPVVAAAETECTCKDKAGKVLGTTKKQCPSTATVRRTTGLSAIFTRALAGKALG